MTLIEYIKTLNLTLEKIDEMPEKRAKEILKIIIAIINEN